MDVEWGVPPENASVALELCYHLFRLTVWSLVSLAAGLLFLSRDRKSGFGAMTAGWALVTLGIVVLSLRTPFPEDLAGFRTFLVFNLGLNVVWAAIGFLMTRKRGNDWIRGAGLAMIQQATVLELLDLFLYWQTLPFTTAASSV